MPTASRLSTADRVSIMELIARYARCLDSGDLDGYVNNFAPDGILFGNHVGHAQIREYVGQVIQRRNADPARRMHFVGFPTIDGNAQRATVHSYLLWLQLGAESPVSAAAEYADTCVKQNGRWVFETRAITRLAGRD
jgi:hypothetical protein